MKNANPAYSFLWHIDNYSHCRHDNLERLISPKFKIETLDGTEWSLSLYPRGDKEESKGFISLYLRRSEADDGPEQLRLIFELSILLADGSNLESKQWKRTFKRGDGYGQYQFIKREEVLLRKKAVCLPQDTLSVSCKICKIEGKGESITHISARTRIAIEEISFIHVVERFSAFKPSETKTALVRYSENSSLLSISLYFSDDSWDEGEMVVGIITSKPDFVLSQCKLSLLDKTGKAIECGNYDDRFGETRQDIQRIPLSIRRQVILNGRSKYLSDDKLTMLYECTFSTGVDYEKYEKNLYQIPFATLNHINGSAPNTGMHDDEEKLSVFPSVLSDLKEIYREGFLTDFELKTKTKSFPAHKMMLCARSHVFKAMMTIDMQEKNNDFIEINDLDDDTVQQFLLFLYSDHIERLQWESAIKLYYAGDKYGVEKLKAVCSSFLMENLSPSSAGELLLLADTHSDTEMKKDVEDFIFNHEEEVFVSDEWGRLIETNSLLVSETMRLKYMRNNANKGICERSSAITR